MAATTSETWETIERWKAQHPELASGAPAPPPRRAERPRLAPAPDPPARSSRAEQEEMIDRWKRDHAALTAPGAARPAAGQPQDWRGNPRPAASRSGESERRVIDIANTPLTILSAFIIGCILGGVAMTIITGLAFWSFSGN
jgi:hypothetical protein